MIVQLEIHGALPVRADVKAGPREIAPGTTVHEFLQGIGLTDPDAASMVVNGRAVRGAELLTEGAVVAVFPKVTGG